MKLNHLYSKNLNIYGDLGNVYAIANRCQVLGADFELVHTELGDSSVAEADMYLIGGGQDEDQIAVFKDLLRHKNFIENEVEKGKVFLLICGGYQLFGKFFLDASGNMIEGLCILDIETKAPDGKVTSRCIGNLAVEMSEDFVTHWGVDTSFSKFLVGFENHGGQTFFTSKKVCTIGNSISGFGNNSIEKLEGCMYKNIIGTYMHGSLLPKNPHLADAIIRKITNNKSEIKNWEFEKKAHKYILKRLGLN